MKALLLVSMLIMVAILPVNAAIQTIDVSAVAGCEDSMDSVCHDHAPVAYIGYFDWYEMGVLFSYEGTKVCFDISTLHGCTASEIYFTYDGLGNPGGYTWAQDNGPVDIKSLIGTCQPVCGTFNDPCSSCPDGDLYVTDSISGGTGNSIQIAGDVIDQAVIDLQAAIDNEESCFCLCMSWQAIISYEVALTNMHLEIEAICAATPTPTITPTPTTTPSPTPSSTPRPIPTTGPGGIGFLLIMFGFLTCLGVYKRRLQ